MNSDQDRRRLEESNIRADDCELLRPKIKDKNWEESFWIRDYDYKFWIVIVIHTSKWEYETLKLKWLPVSHLPIMWIVALSFKCITNWQLIIEKLMRHSRFPISRLTSHVSSSEYMKLWTLINLKRLEPKKI